jgi:chemotaxis receptor (MCP) glutamine deamidase CheD
VELLEQERIAIVEDDLGGSRGRRLVFHTDDGAARVNLI